MSPFFSALIASLRTARAEPAPDPERALIDAALEGDTDAQARLVRRLTPVIWRAVRRDLRGVDDETAAIDLTRQIWLDLWSEEGRRLRQFDPAECPLEHYVATQVAAPVAAEWMQTRAQRLRPFPLDHTPASLRSTEAVEGAREIFARLDARLPPRGRLVLKLLYVDHLTPREAARALGVGPQVVENWHFRIRREAREHATRKRSRARTG